MSKKFATDILWDVDFADCHAYVEKYPLCDIRDYLGKEDLDNYTLIEIEEMVYDKAYNDPEDFDDIVGLPNSVELPNDIDDDDIADYLTNYYGFCVRSFSVSIEEE